MPLFFIILFLIGAAGIPIITETSAGADEIKKEVTRAVAAAVITGILIFAFTRKRGKTT